MDPSQKDFGVYDSKQEVAESISLVDNGRKLFDYLGPVVRSAVSLTSSLRVILLTVLADPIYNILIFFTEKM